METPMPDIAPIVLDAMFAPLDATMAELDALLV
jgi:hypothetical protein